MSRLASPGNKDILGPQFWLRVMTELKNCRAEDFLIALLDGLKGFHKAIAAVFPPTLVQTCIVHLIRNSMDFASRKVSLRQRPRVVTDDPAMLRS